MNEILEAEEGKSLKMLRKNGFRGPRWRRMRFLEVPTWPHDTEFMIHRALYLKKEDSS